MKTIDDFATQLFEEAKRFVEKHDETPNVSAYLHAALNVGMCSFEAHVNAIAEEFLLRPELTAQERSLLAERGVDLVDGEFRVSKQLKIYRIEDRLLFICRRFSKNPIDRSSSVWSNLVSAIKLRNELTHPKGPVVISRDQVAAALEAILEVLDHTYRALYRRGYPKRRLGLQSSMDF